MSVTRRDVLTDPPKPRLGRASSVGGREHPHKRRPHPHLGRRSSSVSLILGLMAAFAIGLPKAQGDEAGEERPRS